MSLTRVIEHLKIELDDEKRIDEEENEEEAADDSEEAAAAAVKSDDCDMDEDEGGRMNEDDFAWELSLPHVLMNKKP